MTQLIDLPPEHTLAEGFARHMVALARQLRAPENCLDTLHRAAYAVSSATQAGHVCITLASICEEDGEGALDMLRGTLQQTGLVAQIDQGSLKPLVLDPQNRLYLARYFDYEQRLARCLMARAGDSLEPPSAAALAVLEGLFAGNRERLEGRADWQKLAVTSALCNRLTIIAGGPGTGKTTTLVSLLGCLLARQPDLRIALAAPTGKAAQRMQDALRERANLLPDSLRACLPREAHTIHRMLGVIPVSHSFRHHADNPLAVDVLVVDEASMLDLALATKLLEALPSQARLVLLGDKDQLAAVEAGAVFSEVSVDAGLDEDCRHRLAELSGIDAALITPQPAKQSSPLRNRTFWLTENLRFGTHSAIARLARHVNEGRSEPAIDILRACSSADIRWFEDGGPALQNDTVESLIAGYQSYLDALNQGIDSIEAIFAAFDRYRILAAVRDSERGVDALNHVVAKHLRERLANPRDDGHSLWYPGRAVMVQRNDYSLKLFNGDVGIALTDGDGQLRVYFPTPDYLFRSFSPAQLPTVETAFVVSVHKSQGSEFDHIALVLPAFPSRVLTRELIYTALTRARHQVLLVGAQTLLKQSIETPTTRHSGLLSRLQETSEGVQNDKLE